MNKRTQNIIDLSINLAVIVGSLAISSYAYSIAPQLSQFKTIPRIIIAVALAVGVKFFRSYPYYLSCQSTPAPGAWRWLILGLTLEGFDLAVLAHIFKLRLSIDSCLGAIATIFGWSGSWGIIALLHNLGLRPVKRRRFYSQWFARRLPAASRDAIDTEVVTIGNDYQEIDLGAGDRTNIDPNIIANLVGTSMKSTFFCGIQGSGKGFLVSLMAAEARRQGHKTFLLDPKGDSDECSLWDIGIDRVARFVGRKEDSPDTYVEKVKSAIKAYCDYAESNGKESYTILIFDEFSSAAGKFAQTKDSKLWLVNEIEDLVKLGDAAGICLWLVAQTPHCKNGIDGSLLSSLRRIIIASADNLAQLQNWTNTTFMNGISLDDCDRMCQVSEVDRAVYNSVTREWLAMPRLRVSGGYYDRDTRRWVGNSPPHAASSDSVADEVADVAADVLAFFQGVAVTSPKTIRDIRIGRRLRKSGATAEDVQTAIDELVMSGKLTVRDGGYILPHWTIEDLN
jgi:hypothetical protein